MSAIRGRHADAGVLVAQNLDALGFLEYLVLDFLGQLTADTELEDRCSTRLIETPEVRCRRSIRLCLTGRTNGQQKRLIFPQASGGVQIERSAGVSLARYLRIAQILHQALSNGQNVTKRDIFYQDVSLFGTQTVTDEIIDNIIASAGLTRRDFNVRATAKGLILAPEMSFARSDGQRITLDDPHGTLIPASQDIAEVRFRKNPEWLLIVEKEAVFQTLSSNFPLSSNGMGQGIIITGKGYPDFATSDLIQRIALILPDLPIHALVDGDPHGIDILSVLTYGSMKSRHCLDVAGIPLGRRLNWLGVKLIGWSGSVASLESESYDLSRLRSRRYWTNAPRLESMIPLVKSDIEFAQSILRKRPDLPLEWKRELSVMLKLYRKAEIQSVLDSNLLKFGVDGVQESQQGWAAAAMWTYVQKEIDRGRFYSSMQSVTDHA